MPDSAVPPAQPIPQDAAAALPVPAAALAPDGRVLAANRAFERLAGRLGLPERFPAGPDRIVEVEHGDACHAHRLARCTPPGTGFDLLLVEDVTDFVFDLGLAAHAVRTALRVVPFATSGALACPGVLDAAAEALWHPALVVRDGRIVAANAAAVRATAVPLGARASVRRAAGGETVLRVAGAPGERPVLAQGRPLAGARLVLLEPGADLPAIHLPDGAAGRRGAPPLGRA